MNRRDVLKALGALPIASAWAGCRHDDSQPAPTPTVTPATAPAVKVKRLQILLEGPFAVVLQKQKTSRRLIAFVPRPDPGKPDLDHYFCFNEPQKKLGTSKDSKNFEFELPEDGLKTNAAVLPYVNADFNDFKAETQVWTQPPSLVSLNLPFPNSINFGGRPLHVKFASRALKATGIMPTNYIIEYNVDNPAKIAMMCRQMGGVAVSSPNCPPGIIRYFFGVGPDLKDAKTKQKHAVDFFNTVLLAKCFPQLREKYTLVDIEKSEDESEETPMTHPTAFNDAEAPALVPAVLQSSQRPRLLRVASLVDCQLGGILVGTDTPALP